MAYAASGLARIGGDSNGSLWMYTTTDAIATVNTAGYFNGAANMLAVRDFVIPMYQQPILSMFCQILAL